eukprot:g39.t1
MSVDPGHHIVAAYDDEFKKLTKQITHMGALAETQLQEALRAVERRDEKLGARVKQQDKEIDRIEREIDALVIRMLALRQPVANDLRFILAALRCASEIERIGDYAKNIAKRSTALTHLPATPLTRGVGRMGALVQTMLKDVMDAFLQGDVEKAVEVWEADEEVDGLYTSLFRELLTYMMEDPRHITPCTHLLFIAKNLERIGDHATNIAEIIHFQVEGELLAERRPKADASNYTVLEPDDDETAVVTLLRYNLEHEGFEVDAVSDGEEALVAVEENPPDLMLLDWMLPQLSGIEVCRQLRRRPATKQLPIIMLTARGEEADTVRGLDAGADDYVPKPFSPAELTARVHALLRRARPALSEESLAVADIRMDLAAHRVRRGEREIKLGPTEYRLLRHFMEHPGRVFSREQLLDAVWGRDVYVELRTVDVHIRRLRKALNDDDLPDLIRTVRSAGYALEPPAA